MFRSSRLCGLPDLAAARAQSLLNVRWLDVRFLWAMLGNAWAIGGRMICWPLSVLMRMSRRQGEACFYVFFSSFTERLTKQGKQCKTKPSKIPTFQPDALAFFRILDTTYVYRVYHALNFNIAYTQVASVYLDNPGGDLSACSTLSVAAQQAGNSRLPSLLKCWSSGVKLMCKASLIIIHYC